jgi:phosphopantothenoylcysteine decarboxylase/phosphopantothenate--cysteine ligase
MGEALAKIASRMGASVTLVTGADRIHYGYAPYDRRPVSHTEEMFEILQETVKGANLYIGAAAVSDYRPRNQDGKIASGQDDLTVSMEPTTDIISTLRGSFPDTTMIGFSADDADAPTRALEKAEKKGLDAVIFNSINQTDGAFGSDSNRASLCVPPEQVVTLGKRSKLSLAQQILLGTINYDLL